MTKSSKMLTVVLSVAVLGVLVYGAVLAFKKPSGGQNTTLPPTEVATIDPSGVVYDAKITIPNTGVTVAYPKKGFNGKGVTLAKSDRGILSVLDSVGNLYIASNPSNSPQVAVIVYKLGNEKTLEEAITTISSQMTDTSIGHYEVMNGTRYFLVPDDSGNPIYSAYAIVKGRLLGVTLNGGFDGSKQDKIPELFSQFLSRLDFNCASDCSVNADSVIDASKGRNE